LIFATKRKKKMDGLQWKKELNTVLGLNGGDKSKLAEVQRELLAMAENVKDLIKKVPDPPPPKLLFYEQIKFQHYQSLGSIDKPFRTCPTKYNGRSFCPLNIPVTLNPSLLHRIQFLEPAGQPFPSVALGYMGQVITGWAGNTIYMGSIREKELGVDYKPDPEKCFVLQKRDPRDQESFLDTRKVPLSSLDLVWNGFVGCETGNQVMMRLMICLQFIGVTEIEKDEKGEVKSLTYHWA
jgi:hypothetical protein